MGQPSSTTGPSRIFLLTLHRRAQHLELSVYTSVSVHITMAWFWRGFQSAVFYYVSCAPCSKLAHQRKRHKGPHPPTDLRLSLLLLLPPPPAKTPSPVLTPQRPSRVKTPWPSTVEGRSPGSAVARMRVVVSGTRFPLSALAARGEGVGKGEAAGAEVEYGDLGGETGRLGRGEELGAGRVWEWWALRSGNLRLMYIMFVFFVFYLSRWTPFIRWPSWGCCIAGGGARVSIWLGFELFGLAGTGWGWGWVGVGVFVSLAWVI